MKKHFKVMKYFNWQVFIYGTQVYIYLLMKVFLYKHKHFDV